MPFIVHPILWINLAPVLSTKLPIIKAARHEIVVEMEVITPIFV